MSRWRLSDDTHRAAPHILARWLSLRRGLLREAVAATVLLALWIALWTVFIAGVVRPAAEFRALAAGTIAEGGAEVATVARAGAHERSGR